MGTTIVYNTFSAEQQAKSEKWTQAALTMEPGLLSLLFEDTSHELVINEVVGSVSQERGVAWCVMIEECSVGMSGHKKTVGWTNSFQDPANESW
jgi:hypothetical protein